ncbi:PhzF family phenazine biosynthesis protein [Allorhodopirellula heiligendammensis]|uniref:Isomerase YddE n=1 Tax=Allorhodopirellula heiligendammensis TaxID=2714739 RepID=A0A5C6B7Y0_9BACT|nr:PhzF family phenazine biosynthesis protein [Allorhodopirellula heiligendammensis]TWU07406.1 putative isomerase YddE [Allorhodopirellula heiligendammensis]
MTPSHNISLWQVDAFADRPFSGNPAAVCILERYPSDEWLEHVAAEMNLSETSFIVPAGESNSFHLRWFTPTTEVNLCGHATLAAAHTLIEQGRVHIDEPIRMQTHSGELVCFRSGERITLDFPATPAQSDVDPTIVQSLLSALGIDQGEVLQTKFDLVVVCDDANTIESLRPDFSQLSRIETRGVMVTAASQRAGIDFISRFFAPRCGIDEDPVTGSAHCCLAPYWASKLGRTSLVGYQASRRGGTVYCELTGDRVQLSGTAVTVMEGQLLVPAD